MLTRNKYSRIISAVSLLVIVIGLAVILGWFLNIPVLTSIGANYVTMKFNTALGFVFIGLSVFLSIRNSETQKSLIQKLLSFLTFLLGALSLSEDVFHVDLGIDQLFMVDQQAIDMGHPFPGRMSPITAVCFSLMGIVFWIRGSKKRSYQAYSQGVLHIVTLLSFIALTGYLFNVPTFYKLSFITSMAVHTSFAFFVLSIVASLINPSIGLVGLFTGQKASSSLARKLFLQMSFGILVLSYAMIAVQRNQWMSVEFAIVLFGISFILITLFLIWRSSKVLNLIDSLKEEAEGNLSKIKTLLDSTPDPIVIVDSKGIIYLTNNQVENVFGYATNDLIGKRIETLLPERFRAGHDKHVNGFFMNPQTRAMGSGVELFALKKSGVEFPVEISLSPIDLVDGTYVSAAIRDITKRKQSEKYLTQKDQEKKRIEEILDRTNEVARIGTWEVDLIKNTVEWSRVTKEIHEVDPDYVPDLETGINFFKEGKSKESIQKAVATAIEHGTTYDLELELVTAKGNFVWTRAIGHAEFKDGKCERLYGVFQDINETKKSRQELHKVNEELHTIFNAGYVSIIGTDVDGLITHFNRGAETLLQYSATEMVGINSPAILHLETEIAARGSELSHLYGKTVAGFDVFIEVPNREKHESREWSYVRKDGSVFPVQLVVTAIRDLDGTITGYLGVATDITELKRAEKELRALLEITTDQNDRLKNFAHIVSHNLRSHSGNIDMLLDLYIQDSPEVAENQYISFLKKGSTNLRETIANLNEVVLINTSVDVELVPINLYEAIESAANNIRQLAKESAVEIVNEVDKTIELLGINAYIDSVLLNFISNGIKYRALDRKSTIVLSATIDKDYVIFQVADNGQGIDLNKYGAKLFGMYKTFHGNEDARGIGLFITKNQVEAMGGKIEVESEVNKGTTFKIYFQNGKN